MDPGLQLLIEIGIAAPIAMFGLWLLKRRSDRKDFETRGSSKDL